MQSRYNASCRRNKNNYIELNERVLTSACATSNVLIRYLIIVSIQRFQALTANMDRRYQTTVKNTVEVQMETEVRNNS
jgi:hypothetical protein